MMRTAPDTALCREAHRLVQAALSRGMFNHSMRTYHLAAEYGNRHAHAHSEEDLMLACLFHDIGLYRPYSVRGKPFQMASSRALKEFLEGDRGIPPERINAMMEAIDFHFQLRPRWDKWPLAGLLQVGAYMDVLGLKSGSIEKAGRSDILRTFPKESFFVEFNLCLVRSFTGWGAVTGILRPESYCRQGHYLDLKT